jgi:hypothetical protein
LHGAHDADEKRDELFHRASVTPAGSWYIHRAGKPREPADWMSGCYAGALRRVNQSAINPIPFGIYR